MPCEVKTRFVLLYGSQKGQAQSIAEGIAEVAEEHGLVAELSCLENNDKVSVVLLAETEMRKPSSDTITQQYCVRKSDVAF